MSESDPVLDLDALLDPARLAAAWQVAHARPPAAGAEGTGVALGAEGAAPEIEATAAEATAVEVTEVDAAEAAEPDRPAPIPVALAHRQLLDEIERTLAASPGLAAKARRVLAAPLAQLAQVVDPVDDPVDLAAAEAALDQLEDVLQALLSETGWPRSEE